MKNLEGYMKREFGFWILLAVLSLLLPGCATAPYYSVPTAHTETLKAASLGHVTVGTVTAQGSDANDDSISIRGHRMHAPQGSFSKYLQSALQAELGSAGLLSPTADVELSAVLLKNEIAALGFVSATGTLEARFVVKNGGRTVFDRIKHAQYQWASSFLGDIAVPRAVASYPKMVSALLDQLYADKDFLKALKPK
jgi:hypothetical protein